MNPAQHDIVLTHIGSSFVVVALIQIFKSWWQKHPKLKELSVALSRTASAVGAILVHLGINWTWNPNEHSLLITGLSLTTVLLALWHILEQFLYQEVTYQGLSGVQAAQGILGELQKINAPKPQGMAKPTT